MNHTVSLKKRKKIIRTASLTGSMYILLEGQLRFLNQYYEIMAVGSDPEKEYLERLIEREGIRGKELTIERRIAIFKDMVSLYKLYRLFRTEKPFMVHSITPKAGLLSMTAAYFARVPKRVHTFTGLIFPTQTGVMKQVLLFFDKIICKFATHIYPEGNGVKTDLLSYKVTNKPLRIIANGNVNGVDLEAYNPEVFLPKDNNAMRTQLGVEKEDVVFVFVGRLVNDKGVNELVHAFCSLSEKFKQAKLVMLGSDEGESDLLPKATGALLAAQPAIRCVGHQEDVRPYLAASDVFVFPSYREGFPNVVLEAGAMGLPAIVTDINGSNEIITERENGLIIPSKDSKALYRAMELLLTNNALRKDLAKNARPMISARFKRSMVWDAVLKEYQRIEASNPIS
ncbi:glycosyl transferase family 1 [Maribacter sp. 4U21]|uniref:glycosyltransferase family 4 protein n=1 Tax=Maribacter sp. 4U21 TaxID=1889779 RepID=UPI000C1559D0|nr:glycosyltransferase family 4 protein [Maribacter sp. 4U21]PIB31204.1 glycosyl transferase family 1 [Maribacter sp. 4U21]